MKFPDDLNPTGSTIEPSKPDQTQSNNWNSIVERNRISIERPNSRWYSIGSIEILRSIYSIEIRSCSIEIAVGVTADKSSGKSKSPKVPLELKVSSVVLLPYGNDRT